MSVAGRYWSQRMRDRITSMKESRWELSMRATEVTADIDDSNRLRFTPDDHFKRTLTLLPEAHAWIVDRLTPVETASHVDYGLYPGWSDSPFGYPYRIRNDSFRLGSWINMSSLEYSMMVASLYRYTEGDIVRKRIVEIGGGYGGLASRLLQLWPKEYVSVDLEPMIRIQAAYLPGVLSLNQIEDIWRPLFAQDFFDPSHVAADAFSEADLVINTRSFMEMDLAQVHQYIGFMEHFLRPGSLFYSLNRDKVNAFREWRMDDRWKTVSETPWPHRPGMVERIFRRI